MTKRLLMHLAFIASVVSSPAFADKYNFYFAQSAEDSNSDGIPDSNAMNVKIINTSTYTCLLYTSPSPRDGLLSRMPSSA